MIVGLICEEILEWEISALCLENWLVGVMIVGLIGEEISLGGENEGVSVGVYLEGNEGNFLFLPSLVQVSLQVFSPISSLLSGMYLSLILHIHSSISYKSSSLPSPFSSQHVLFSFLPSPCRGSWMNSPI